MAAKIKQMIIDFHTHLFPKEIRDGRETYFPHEPEFKLLYESPRSKMAGVDDIIVSMDEGGVNISVVFGFPWRNPVTLKKNNDYIIKAVQKHPDRFKGFCCLDLYGKDAFREAERCISEGLSGIGEIALYQSGIDEAALIRLTPIMELCQKNDLPILIHTNEPVGHAYPGKTPITLNQVYQLVKRFPDNTIVLAHWGGGIFFFSLLKREVKPALKNVYFDTAASPFLYDSDIYSLAAQLIGSGKILFGSDYPLIKPSRYFDELEKSGLSKEDVEAICGQNAKRLLHL